MNKFQLNKKITTINPLNDFRIFSTCYAKLPHAMPKNLAEQDF
jgi:hypothetical protein